MVLKLCQEFGKEITVCWVFVVAGELLNNMIRNEVSTEIVIENVSLFLLTNTYFSEVIKNSLLKATMTIIYIENYSLTIPIDSIPRFSSVTKLSLWFSIEQRCMGGRPCPFELNTTDRV